MHRGFTSVFVEPSSRVALTESQAEARAGRPKAEGVPTGSDSGGLRLGANSHRGFSPAFARALYAAKPQQNKEVAVAQEPPSRSKAPILRPAPLPPANVAQQAFASSLCLMPALPDPYASAGRKTGNPSYSGTLLCGPDVDGVDANDSQEESESEPAMGAPASRPTRLSQPARPKPAPAPVGKPVKKTGRGQLVTARAESTNVFGSAAFHPFPSDSMGIEM